MKKECELWDLMCTKISENKSINLSSCYSVQLDKELKHFNNILSSYRFVSKMIECRKKINLLELGCNNGIGTQLFLETKACQNIIGVDFDQDSIQWAKDHFENNIIKFHVDDFLNHNFCNIIGRQSYDVIVSFGVIENIDVKEETDFLKTINLNLDKNGFAVIGTNNTTIDQQEIGETANSNIRSCDSKRLYESLSKVFNHVFIFWINNETICTDFCPTSCYILALCSGKK